MTSTTSAEAVYPAAALSQLSQLHLQAPLHKSKEHTHIAVDANLPAIEEEVGPHERKRDVVAGTIAGAAQVLAGHPFDTIKVRLQTQAKLEGAHAGPRFTGAIDCVVKTVKWEGISGLYKGMSMPLVASGAFNAILFGAYAHAKEWMSNGRPETLTLPQIGICGASAGFLVCFVACPTELIRNRLQVQYGPALQGATAAAAANFYTGPADAAAKIFRAQGVPGLYRGLTATLMRQCPANLFSFPAYEFVRRSMTREGESSPGPLANLMAGGAAGTVYWTTIYPIDLIKSRLQTDLTGRYRGIWHCFQLTKQHEGWRGLYKGFWPCLARAFPANAVTFMTYELLTKLMGNV
eukprot:tig00000480_g1306.t1